MKGGGRWGRLAFDTDRIAYSDHSEANLSNDFTSIFGWL